MWYAITAVLSATLGGAVGFMVAALCRAAHDAELCNFGGPED